MILQPVRSFVANVIYWLFHLHQLNQAIKKKRTIEIHNLDDVKAIEKITNHPCYGLGRFGKPGGNSMTKLLKVLLFLWFFILAIPLVSHAFDKELTDEQKTAFAEKYTSFNNVYTFVRVKVVGTADVLVPVGDEWVRAEGTFDQEGSGTVMSSGWVLTASHVVEPLDVEFPIESTVVFHTRPIKVNTRRIVIHDYRDTGFPAWISYEDVESDVALLRYVPINNSLRPLDVSPAFAPIISTLEQGDILAVVTHKRDDDLGLSYELQVTWGKVVTPEPDSFSNYMISALSPYDITMDIPLQGGDSGSIVFVFHEGKPMYLAIARMIIYDFTGSVFLTYAARIDSYFLRFWN